MDEKPRVSKAATPIEWFLQSSAPALVEGPDDLNGS